MLFLNIWTYGPEQRDKAVQRRAEIGLGLGAGAKVLHEWSDLAGGRGFLIVEADDTTPMLQGILAWSDILEMEIIPIVDTNEVLKMAK